jgi:hypothetical protein
MSSCERHHRLENLECAVVILPTHEVGDQSASSLRGIKGIIEILSADV